MSGGGVPLEAIMEASHAPGEDGAWLERLVHATRPVLDHGLGVLGFFYDMSEVTSPTLRAPVLVGTPPGTREALEHLLEQAPHVLLRMLFRLVPSCTTMSDRLRLGEGVVDLPLHRSTLAPLGIADFLAVAATDASGAGCLVGAPLPRVTPSSDLDTTTLAALAAHVAGGMRARLGRPTSPVSTEEQAAPIWAALTAGKWTVVGSFERAGSRVVLARQGAAEARAESTFVPSRDPGGALTAREEDVAARAALGHSNKTIAAALGIAPSTVAGHLGKAARKLDAHSRAELMRAVVRRRR